MLLKFWHIFISASAVLYPVVVVYSHPQCLDFRPPFQSQNVGFCLQYKTFGCCSQNQDEELQARFENILMQLNETEKQNCSSFVKELLCQTCSPYSAHIYSAEETLMATSFPGLCPEYCLNFYSTCKDVVKYLTDDRQLLASLNSADTFCLLIKLTDNDYCYPDLLHNPNLNFKISLPQISSEGCLCVEAFAWNLRSPLLARHANDGSGRLFIAEQRGVIYIYYKNKTRERRAFLDIKDRVLHTSYIADERGFLGLAFHPQFAQNQRFYVYYSARLPNSRRECVRISEFRVFRKNRNRANGKSERVIIEVEQPYANHNGGEILFGDDGYLYIFVGDGGSGGDPHGYSQNKSVLLGKVLRIDVNNFTSSTNYSIPPDNPFVNESKSRPEIYAFGIRNIWRCDKDEGDPLTGEGKGRIICGDVGQNAFEEIDIIYKGANYGWNGREGYQCYNPKSCGKVVPEELPIFSYPHAIGKSITGGHVYRGCESPNLNGLYIYGDFSNGRLFRLMENKTSQMWVNKELFMCGNDVCFNGLLGYYEPFILSFGEDEDGEIYILSTGMPSALLRTGRVYKLVDPLQRGDPDSCRSRNFLNDTQIPLDLNTNLSDEWGADESGTESYFDDYGSGECLDPSGYICTPGDLLPSHYDIESASGSGLESGSGSGNGSDFSDGLDRDFVGQNKSSSFAESDIYIEPSEKNTSIIVEPENNISAVVESEKNTSIIVEPENNTSVTVESDKNNIVVKPEKNVSSIVESEKNVSAIVESENSRNQSHLISTDGSNRVSPTLDEGSTFTKESTVDIASSGHLSEETSGDEGSSLNDENSGSGSTFDSSSSGEISGSGIEELSLGSGERSDQEVVKSKKSRSNSDFYVESRNQNSVSTVQTPIDTKLKVGIKLSNAVRPQMTSFNAQTTEPVFNEQTIEDSENPCSSGDCLEGSTSGCSSGSSCVEESGSGCSSEDCAGTPEMDCFSGDCVKEETFGRGCSSGHGCSKGCSSGHGCSNLDLSSKPLSNDQKYLDAEDLYLAEYLGINKINRSRINK